MGYYDNIKKYEDRRKSQLCPRCGSVDMVRAGRARGRIPAGIFARACLDRWVCCSCGYCELRADKEKLDKIRDFWREPPEDPR